MIHKFKGGEVDNRFQSSKEEASAFGFRKNCVDVEGPVEVSGDIDTQKFGGCGTGYDLFINPDKWRNGRGIMFRVEVNVDGFGRL